MGERLLICTDLDRTLIPNGPQAESPGARRHFARLADSPGVTLAYVSGRDRSRIEKAIANYLLPTPDYVIGDVGTTIYHVGEQHDWRHQPQWEEEIAQDWGGRTHGDLKRLLADVPDLRLQEYTKQNAYKLSYYLPLQCEREVLFALIERRLEPAGVKARLIWSVDEPNGVGLLDILPERASKYHAIRALMEELGFDCADTVFCGDSGNDIEVLASPIPAVLVANGQPEVRELAGRLAGEGGHSAQLYLATGGFMGMNGNYSAGMLEGIAHYHPLRVGDMGFADEDKRA